MDLLDKLEAVQRVLRFSDKVRVWVETEHKIYFDDFDNYNVEDYESGYGELADEIIRKGIEEQVLDEEDLADFS